MVLQGLRMSTAACFAGLMTWKGKKRGADHSAHGRQSFRFPAPLRHDLGHSVDRTGRGMIAIINGEADAVAIEPNKK
jgi:hypothetical protein